jgi:putative tryptophan/tyrosine transport system substrate-binding protein
MKRREFITLLGGAATAWPLAARAQNERVRRIGVLMSVDANDPEMQGLVAALMQGLRDAGWTVGRNLQVELRNSAGNVPRLRKDAEDLIALGSEVIVAGVGPTTSILQQLTRTVPIVFAQTIDPVGNGFIERMSRPGGNITGFTQFEYVLSAKWLELLMEVAPTITRAGVIRELAGGPAGIGQWAVIAAAASSLNVELTPINLSVGDTAEGTAAELARTASGGLIVAVGSLALAHRNLIISLAARHKLPAIYPYRFFVEAGGLMSYGANLAANYRLTAGYVDRILKGEKPADLPVQAPTKYELVINLKSAKALGIEIPTTLLARADEVIE